MMNNKKGFTLVELLAVIVVLAIIMAIATGAVTKTIETTRKKSFISSYDIIVKNIKNNIDQVKLGLMNSSDIVCDDITNGNECFIKYDYSKEDYKMSVLDDGSGNFDISFEGDGKFKNIDLGTSISTGCPSSGACLNFMNKQNNNNSVFIKISQSDGIVKAPVESEVFIKKVERFIEKANENIDNTINEIEKKGGYTNDVNGMSLTKSKALYVLNISNYIPADGYYKDYYFYTDRIHQVQTQQIRFKLSNNTLEPASSPTDYTWGYNYIVTKNNKKYGFRRNGNTSFCVNAANNLCSLDEEIKSEYGLR